ncbi:L-2-amino-thiazoline-4-carboxylic acid hydrolase [Devosia sp. ZB163]|uniref:L-2-amino-thiazoline-4-carboxylic acid hydrolase n=1 Tax=Devosia sp. ZB163 TaxID=3025938 RepID=UPI0023606F1F|nr:L-2-amino-thiazoline-4-carboxylic acid hydrolase [Devosia sp. ZB163]MDC9826164.1 L-2-amino-thiazoline-4-carboxylic acid hydrolase [Devosia sp. ZB163]
MTPFERITTQVQAQIPLVRAMEAALGKEVAHRLVREALDKANREIVAQRGSLLDIPTLASEFAGFGEGIRYEFETIEQTDILLRNQVNHCDYAEFMEQIGARDLGELLICNGDFAMADELGLKLERTKTCMNGDGMCNFCYHLKPERLEPNPT